jgi:hypothetical protein
MDGKKRLPVHQNQPMVPWQQPPVVPWQETQVVSWPLPQTTEGSQVVFLHRR